MKRPLVLVTIFYVIGILISRAFVLAPYALLSVSLCVAAAAIAWTRMRLWLLYGLCVLAGWTNSVLQSAVISPNDVRRIVGTEPVIATVRGVLCETPTEKVFVLGEKESWHSVAQLRLSAIQTNQGPWAPAEGWMAITTAGTISSNFYGGQTVEILGVAALPKVAAAEGLFDYRAFLAEKGVYRHLQVSSDRDWTVLASPRSPPLADRFRTWAQRALAYGLPGEDETLRLEWALTLGRKEALTEEVSEPFMRAATYHIFAVDGLRMAIISGIFITLLRALRVPRAACALILIPVIWSYTALTGWPASAIRANIMLTIVIAGWVLKRPSDTINSLFAAALAILLWQPGQLYQAGFQLSFVVVFYIILTVTAFERVRERLIAPDPLLPEQLRPRWRRILETAGRYVLEVVCSSLGAWIASVPLVAFYFHMITPVSTPANVLTIPLCILVLICNSATLLLFAWFPAAAELFNHAGWALMKAIEASSQWFAELPGAYWYVPKPLLFTVVLYYALLLAVATGWLFRSRLRSWKLAAATAALAVWGGHFWLDSRLTRLSILPANGGMAIFFHAPGSKSDLLIDCGATNSVQFLTKPFLRAQGVNRLPALVLTHGDLRHVGGAELLAADFRVSKLAVSPLRFRSPTYRKIIADWSATPERLLTISRTNTLGAWTVLHPAAGDRYSQADDGALVLEGNIPGCRILLLSDLGRLGQDALLERTPDLRADILVTGLPAQNEPIADALIDAVQPRLIIVADSEYPPVERASHKLHERLARRKIPVIYTRAAGAVTIESRDGSWELRTVSGIRLGKDLLGPLPDPMVDKIQAPE